MGNVSANEVSILDAFAGFSPRLQLTEMNDCMMIKVMHGGRFWKALLDTGCEASLIFQDASNAIDLPKASQRGVLKGIGNVSASILGSMNLKLGIGNLEMKETTFYIISGKNEWYDMILGCEFLRTNGFEICPRENVIRIRDGDGFIRLSFSPDGELNRKHLCEVNLRATESMEVMKGERKSIGVSWRGWEEETGLMMYGTGCRNTLERKGLTVLDGVLDERNPRIWVSSRKNKRIRVNQGDVVGLVFTVLELDAVQQADEWTRESLKEQLNTESHLTEPEVDEIVNMLYERRAAISLNEEDLGATRFPAFSIELSQQSPIYQRPRYFPAPISREIEEQCERLEQMGVIEESESPWNSPIVPIRKPDGTLRICVDYRRVNDVTIKARFPMNLVADSVYRMHGMKVFTKLDLLRGYYQMEVEEGSRPITAFSTAHKHFQFKRLSFGLANAPGAFQKGMNVLLSRFPSANVTVFIDDILIMNENRDDHLKLVEEVLRTLIYAGIKVKYSKCQWCMQKVEFLGHTFSENGIRKSESFVEKVRKFPKPRTVRELRGFLGLVNFQRKFMKDCSGIIQPLTV